jgi:DNA-binding Lrp family transcriptional regulator
LNSNRELSPKDKALIRLLSGDLPLCANPYGEIAKELNITEDEVLKSVAEFKKRGLIRRIGAILVHQKSGFGANAMIAWEFPDDTLVEAGKRFASLPYVSHCYQRETAPGWPYNLYTMIHAESEEELRNRSDEMSSFFAGVGKTTLESVKELKKSSVVYFTDSRTDLT